MCCFELLDYCFGLFGTPVAIGHAYQECCKFTSNKETFMKRLFFALVVVATFGLFSVTSANAADRYHHSGYGGHGHAHQVAPYRHSHRAQNYGYSYGHASHHRSQHYNSHFGGSHYGYYGNGHQGVHVTTPYFGLHFGH
jgi:hypothetical protein